MIYGLAGTNGAGKDTVGELLARDYNYLFVSVSDILREECRRRNLEVIRENLSAISAEWRRVSGLGVLVDKAVEVLHDSGKSYLGLVLASIRNAGEVERIHELNGKVIWVDADPKIRYDRIQKSNRGRGGEDDRTFKQFLADEEREMHTVGDSATLDMAAVKDKSDVTLMNESTIGEFSRKIESEFNP